MKDNGFSQEVASTLPIYNDPFASRTIDVARLQCLGSVCKCSPYEAVIGGGKDRVKVMYFLIPCQFSCGLITVGRS